MGRYFVFLLVFILFFNGFNSQIHKDDYSCLNKLAVKILNLSLYSLNSTTKQYNFCSKVNKNEINCNSDGRITGIQVVHFKKINLLSPNDFICFPFLKSIGVESFVISKNFLYGPFPDSLDERVFLLNGDLLSIFDVDTEIGFNNTIKRTEIDILRVNGGVATSLNTTVYMSTISHFKNIEFIYGTAAITNKTNFIIENDLNENKKSSFKDFTSYCSNIPPLSYNNGTIDFVELTFLPSFDKESVSNFSSYSNVLDIYLYSWDPNQVFPFPLGLSNIPPGNKLIYLTIDSPGNLFNFNGKFPFSSFYKNLEHFALNDGNFSELPKLEDVFKEKITVINLNNNSIGGNVQTTLDFGKLPNLKVLKLKNNKLTGSIDESWCRVNFDISNNLISGEAPGCVICHVPDHHPRIRGINFTNWDPKPPCTSIIPNLMYDNSSDLLLLYGQDIGFSPMDMYILDISYKFSFSCDMPGYPEIYNTQFCLKYISTDGPNPYSFNITYQHLPPGSKTTFELAAYNMFLPLVNTAILDYSNESLTIAGRYFSYNKTVINIQVNGKTCNIESCDFNEIKCNFSNDNNNNSNFNGSNVFVQIMNVSSEICISKCNDDVPYECEFKFERCNCSEGWEGDNCETLKRCPNDCSGAGICNHITGICLCNSGRIQDDCSVLGFECKSDCLNGSKCNYAIGKCDCILGWEGDDCSSELSSSEPSSSSELSSSEPSKSNKIILLSVLLPSLALLGLILSF
ncbi:hypothetical protein DDB_G0286963 [Dictyostelium discoideum AX4]|uniref:EGF-like domain-containing protein n=1 Tax=Dictyostelium discoideum TaxID=44689 RepID=Q54L31_DICDI|nr:hypothetical protein DDB_G0286963 [Dictyostelium discoideum AX4]EAL63979.1 hypothetical protein DDB_G0286963 [Dictyostelium discoideum AX4]|eukprot:XP_637472.1 hypothetical protein DDB_G0286963 [Dictyostelium discoideum AX4]